MSLTSYVEFINRSKKTKDDTPSEIISHVEFADEPHSRLFFLFEFCFSTFLSFEGQKACLSPFSFDSDRFSSSGTNCWHSCASTFLLIA